MKNLLIKIDDEQLSKAVQEKLFENGCKWVGTGVGYYDLDTYPSHIFVNNDGLMSIFSEYDVQANGSKIINGKDFIKTQKPKGKYRIRKAIEKRIEELNDDPDFIKDAYHRNVTVVFFELHITDQNEYAITSDSYECYLPCCSPKLFMRSNKVLETLMEEFTKEELLLGVFGVEI